MVFCGYGNCQPTTWTREVPVDVFAPTPSGDETVWVKETLTSVTTVAGTFVTGCVVAVGLLGLVTYVSGGTSAVVDLPGDVTTLTCVTNGLYDAAHSILTWLPF